MPRKSEPRFRVLNIAVPPTLPAVVASKGVETAVISGGKGLAYGEGDTLPLVALDAALDSGTTYRCLERRSEFLEGTGFPVPVTDPKEEGYDETKVETMGLLPVPGQPGKTANDFWSEVCSSMGYFNGVAILIKYATDGSMGERYVLPFHAVRKTDKGTFLLNHKFGRKGYNKKDTTEHQAFDNRQETVDAILEKAGTPIDPKKPDGPKHVQHGQILWVHKPKPGEEDYPLPPHWAGLEDTLTDAEYGRFDYEEVRNGFFATAMLTLIGKKDAATEGEDGKTEEDRVDEELRQFTGNNNSGTGRKKLFVVDAENKDAAPVLTPFNGNSNVEKLIEKRESIGQIVCRNIGIPPILAGFAKAGQLGASQEIMNAVELTQNSLAPQRQLAVRAFLRVMPELKGLTPGFKPPISFVPSEVYAKLSANEIRKLGGYSPSSSQNTALNKLQDLDKDTAAQVLGVMSPTQLLALVGLAPETPSTTQS